jgi:hypothetical protein
MCTDVTDLKRPCSYHVHFFSRGDNDELGSDNEKGGLGTGAYVFSR